MFPRWMISLFLIAATAILGVAHFYYQVDGLATWWGTAISITVLYLSLRVAVDWLLIKRIRDPKTRYSLRKAINIIFYLLILVVVMRIWVQDPQTLLVTYGLVGAGVAVALQDFFKNFVGGVMIFTSELYKVGDRIEVGDLAGDVIDTGLFYTVVMEIGNWVEGNQVTGRLVNLPNGVLLHQNVKNFSKDHDFLWDEVAVPVTFESDWQKAKQIMERAAKKYSQQTSERAGKKLRRLGGKYYYIQRETKPEVYTELTDNWIMLRVRYVTDVTTRRIIRHNISEEILKQFDQEKKINIASATLDIIGLPKVNVKQVKR